MTKKKYIIGMYIFGLLMVLGVTLALCTLEGYISWEIWYPVCIYFIGLVGIMLFIYKFA